MTADIGELARIAYETGVAPLDYAEAQVALILGVHAAITVGGGSPPGEFPGLPVGADAFAGRILGALLEAGWSMPVWPVPEPCQEAS